MIDLRSDTVTRPTEAMLESMREATFGDDSREGDATVQKLEAMAAERTGKEAGAFMPSGTMTNLVAMLAHGGRGGEVLLEEGSHTLNAELGGIAGVAGLFHRGAARHQQLEQRNLHSCLFRMNTRGGETERRAAATVCRRRRIDVRSRVEQGSSDLDDVRRRQLTPVFDAVGGDVVEQRRLMLARRSRRHEAGVLAQKPLERLQIARHDGVGRLFEPHDRRLALRERLEVRDELRPARELVHERDEVLGVGSAVRAIAGPSE